MIRLGLRLTLGSGREAMARVLVTTAAVALGVALLLAALAGVNGLHAQTDRGAWLDTSAQASRSTRHPTNCGGGRALTSSTARQSTGLTSPRPGPTLRSHRG